MIANLLLTLAGGSVFLASIAGLAISQHGELFAHCTEVLGASAAIGLTAGAYGTGNLIVRRRLSRRVLGALIALGLILVLVPGRYFFSDPHSFSAGGIEAILATILLGYAIGAYALVSLVVDFIRGP